MKDFYEIVKNIRDSDSSYHSGSKLGLFNVKIVRSKKAIMGFFWRYEYYDGETDKVRTISAVDLQELREKVEQRQLPWMVTDIDKATKVYAINKEMQELHGVLYLQSRQRIADKRVNTPYNKPNKYGVKYIYIGHNKGLNYWIFNRQRIVDGERKVIALYSRTLLGLKEKVLSRGLEWEVLDDELYQKSLELDIDEVEL